MEENKEDEASQTISSSEFDCVSDCSYQFPREQELEQRSALSRDLLAV
jgi:hypothetical protein